MARKKIGSIIEVKVNLASYTYLMNGTAGIGKTTTVSKLGMAEFGQDGFLLLTIGEEPAPVHIGGLWNAVVKDWDELSDTIDDLCEYKNEDYPNLRMVGVDSIGEIFRLAEEKVIAMHNKKVANPSDRIDTINKAFGGFQAGQNKVVALVTSTLFKLRDYGISIFFIGHTKQKNKTDLLTEIEYEQITSDLDNKYYNCIKDKVNIVMCAYTERTFTDLKTRRDAFSKTNKDVGQIAKEERVVSFRDNSYAIDTKSHLKYICDKCALDSDVIIKELKDAMRKQNDIFSDKKITDDEIAKKEKKEIEELKEEKPKVDDTKVKTEKLEKIKQNLEKLDMTKLQEIMTKYKITNFEDAATIPMECLDEILEQI